VQKSELLFGSKIEIIELTCIQSYFKRHVFLMKTQVSGRVFTHDHDGFGSQTHMHSAVPRTGSTVPADHLGAPAPLRVGSEGHGPEKRNLLVFCQLGRSGMCHFSEYLYFA
jgi:hypothetical protein